MDKKEAPHLDAKGRKSGGAPITPKKAASKTIKVAARPAAPPGHPLKPLSPTVSTASASASATNAKVDNAYAAKARREWERLFSRKPSDAPPVRTTQTVPQAPPKRKRADGTSSPAVVSPGRHPEHSSKHSESSSKHLEPAAGRPLDPSGKHSPAVPTPGVVFSPAYAGRRTQSLVAASTGTGAKRPSVPQNKRQEPRPVQPTVTILRIREPECVPAVDLNIPGLNKSESAGNPRRTLPPGLTLRGCSRNCGAPIIQRPGGPKPLLRSWWTPSRALRVSAVSRSASEI
jgi:hypothetical protein